MDTQENTQSRYKRCKNHLKENRHAYIAGAVCLLAGFAAGGALAKRGEVKGIKQVNVLINSDNSTVGNTVTTSPEPPRQLSYITEVDGELFETQTAAAKELGVSTNALSKHINHGEPLPDDAKDAKVKRMGVRTP